MDKIVKYFFVFLLATMIVCNAACSRGEETDLYGVVKGTVTPTIGESQGFKVSLIESNSNQTIHVIVTEDGSFCFSNVVAGKYKIDVQKEGFYCIRVIVNNRIVNSDYEIQVEENQIVEVDIQMNPDSSYLNGELTIRDAYGNPIGNRITIPEYTQVIALRLYNETSQDISWYTRLNSCYLEGARDTVVSGYSGFTGFGIYQIFSDFSPNSGTISPGENVLVTGIINQSIYELDYFSRENNTLSIYANSSTHMYRKDIELYLPFVNITDMSDWYD